MSNEYYSPQGGGSFPPPYPQPFSAPVAKKKWWKRWWVWLIVGLVGSLFACSASVFLFIRTLYDSPAVKVASSYYSAIEQQDYATAYSFLDPRDITVNGQQITKEAYVQEAERIDGQRGNVTSHSIPSVSLESVGGVNSAKITVRVTRSKGDPYGVNLRLQQKYSGWKITYIDDI